jgi:hypothetical protein
MIKNTKPTLNKARNGNKSKPLLCDVLLTKDDFSLINGLRNGMTSFAIQTLSEDIFNDALAQNLESFFEEKRIYADRFNVEYMGFLTGQVAIETDKIEMIIPIINEFLKNIA